MCHNLPVPQISDRQRVMISAELHSQFRPIVIARGHSHATLAWCWLRDAVIAAGEGKRLPSRLDSGPVWPAGTGKEIKWKQDSAEYIKWAQVLRSANSSPTAVIRSEVRAYIDCEGDVAHVGDLLGDLVYG